MFYDVPEFNLKDLFSSINRFLSSEYSLPTRYEAGVRLLGKRLKTSGPFMRSLKLHGLIEVPPPNPFLMLKLTPLALQLNEAPDQESFNARLKQAFLTPTIFSIGYQATNKSKKLTEKTRLRFKESIEEFVGQAQIKPTTKIYEENLEFLRGLKVL